MDKRRSDCVRGVQVAGGRWRPGEGAHQKAIARMMQLWHNLTVQGDGGSERVIDAEGDGLDVSLTETLNEEAAKLVKGFGSLCEVGTACVAVHG